MKDYTTNNFCDFLWIEELLKLEQNQDKLFTLEIKNNGKPTKVTISGVIIFGTIVGVKQIENGGFLYQVDDGTGVIACKRNEKQFHELINIIESEQADNLSQIQSTFDEYSLCDSSANDSIFNDRSMQLEEINFNKKSRLRGLQSIWDDVYDSFSNLIKPYKIGDTVIVEGKLYSYIHVNQIYINTIRPMGIAEEIILTSVKLEDGLHKSEEEERVKKPRSPVNRMSGLLTFDNIPHFNPKITFSRNIESPETSTEGLTTTSDLVPPNLESAMTFDTFTAE